VTKLILVVSWLVLSGIILGYWAFLLSLRWIAS
jgi:hypothetical protein